MIEMYHVGLCQKETVFPRTRDNLAWAYEGLLLWGIKRPGRAADLSHPTSDEVKKEWSYISSPQNAFLTRCSIKAHEELYLYLYIRLIFTWKVDKIRPKIMQLCLQGKRVKGETLQRTRDNLGLARR